MVGKISPVSRILSFFNLSGKKKLALFLEGLKNLGQCMTRKGKKVLIEIMGH